MKLIIPDIASSQRTRLVDEAVAELDAAAQMQFDQDAINEIMAAMQSAGYTFDPSENDEHEARCCCGQDV